MSLRPMLLGGAVATLMASVGLQACDATEDAILAAVSGGCLLDSDCEGELVCRFRRCHQRCETNKDCPLRDDGDRQDCVVVDKPVRICQLDIERLCSRHSDCPDELFCGLDGNCRARCATARDCTPGQVCVAGTCVEPGDLDDLGQLPLADASPREGALCTYNSDCPPRADGLPLRCRGGSCEASCNGSDRDCSRFETCSTEGTDPPEPGECMLIGDPGMLFCSPKEGEPDRTAPCSCPGGSGGGTQTCNPDGSGYGPCLVGTTPCPLP